MDPIWKYITLALLLLLIPFLVCHLCVIPKTKLWRGGLEWLPLMYLLTGLIGQWLVAILYGKSYSAVIISSMGSIVALIVGLAGLQGIYDWIEKSAILISVVYVAIR